MDTVHNPVILSVVHDRQNTLYATTIFMKMEWE
jgi:hypothetical protein